MTRNKARKRLVRQRSDKTGESYTAALRQLLANKEKSVSTIPMDRSELCALCRTDDDGTTNFVTVGLTFCISCHERLATAVRNHLEPEAARMRRPLDFFLSALVVVPDGDAWVVHLHTLQPGHVIGRRGETADAIRASLVEITQQDRLRLNIVPHEPFGCGRPSDD